MIVRWTQRAAFDLTAIARFISEDNPRAAERTIRSIRLAVKKLQRFPRIGRTVPEFGDDATREILIGNYRVVYRIGAKAIDVYAVFEGHRLMPIDSGEIDDSD